MARFPGVHVAVITPFTQNDEVDYPRLREHVEWLLSSGIHGLIPTGSCGEYASLLDQERAKVVETIAETTAGRVPVIYDSQPILVQAIKYCLELAGRSAGQTRPPRLELEESVRQQIEIAYHNIQAGLTA